jgi:hypothetical protein
VEAFDAITTQDTVALAPLLAQMIGSLRAGPRPAVIDTPCDLARTFR